MAEEKQRGSKRLREMSEQEHNRVKQQARSSQQSQQLKQSQQSQLTQLQQSQLGQSQQQQQSHPRQQQQHVDPKQEGALEQQQHQHELRVKYQHLSAKVKAHQERDGLGIEDNAFEAILEEANNMSTKAERPREQLHDADVLESLSFNVRVQARKLNQHQGRAPADFVSSLARVFGRGGGHNPLGGRGGGAEEEALEGAMVSEHSFDWARMGREEGVEFFQPAITFGTMLGPLSAEAPKRRNLSQRRRRDVVGAAVAPDEVDADVDAAQNDKEREEETQARVAFLFKNIHTRGKRNRESGIPSGATPVLSLLVDQGSFAKTVENVFALSFLVKDGRCQLSSTAQQKLPPRATPSDSLLAEVKNAPKESERAASSFESSQFIVRLDYKDWQVFQELSKATA